MKYEQLTKDNFKVSANAEWEIKTTGFIEHQKARQRFNSIRAADEASLNMRRRRLADMLAHEHATFQVQLEQLDESPEQRKVRMEMRAGELKDKPKVSGWPTCGSSTSANGAWRATHCASRSPRRS